MSENNTTYTLGRVGLNPRGAYSASATYEKLDVVNYEGSSYAALARVTGVLPTNTTNWTLLAQGTDAESPALPGYSTNEHLTGETWIDGKAIYRKNFYNTGTLNSGNIVNVAHGISNAESFIEVSGTAHMTTGQWVNANIPFSSNRMMCLYVDGSNLVVGNNGGGWVIDKVIATLRYTKTS